MELMRAVIHHVADEETMLLTHAETILGGRLSELGAQMAKRRLELTAPRAVSGRPFLMLAGALLAGVWLARRRA
jgi:hypothetical protein